LEALLISFMSMLIGTASLYFSLLIARDLLSSEFGLHIGLNILSYNNILFLLLVVSATIVVSTIPSFTAYKRANKND